jgi:hypothetical protein
VVGFFDEQFQLPSISTYVYLGQDAFEDSQSDTTHYFQYAASYAKYGDLARNDAGSGRGEFIQLEEDELHVIVDKKELSGWVLSNHSPRLPKS